MSVSTLGVTSSGRQPTIVAAASDRHSTAPSPVTSLVGSREQPQMSGWQHMLRALSQGQQQSHGEADVLVSGAEAPMDASQSGAASTPTAPAAGAMTVAGMDGRQLRDGVLAVIRSL